MSAAGREYFEDWQREVARDTDWLATTNGRTTKDHNSEKQENEHDSQSEKR